ncbi:sensor histidine kinase [Halonatronum saccharophilum]|uniref:sensor histidine kinase n=1 Tax=Halonatronum saccharophilum TaxID=150060 RepID=UPI000485D572|nr:HAMP domain-containing sensor histidine kinase [Halonatronum saccharophilum]
MKLINKIKQIRLTIRRILFKKFRYKLLATFLLGNIIASIIIISSYILVGKEIRLITFSLLTVVAGLFSVLIDYYISQPVTQAIDELTAAANKIAKGKFDEGKVSVNVQSELLQLADAFNVMNYKLNEAFKKQKKIEQARRDLVTNISHDLKTPLATIQLFSESILDGVLEDEEVEKRYLKTIIEEANNIRILIDQLARLSEFEAGEVRMSMEKINLVQLVCNFLKTVELRLEEKGIEITIDAPQSNKDSLVVGDPTKIYQVIANLINNSIKYTPEGGKIRVEILARKDYIQIDIIDNGIGIPIEDQDRIFERFYRVDKSRNRQDKGSGLGLAIAKEIVNIHGGEIWVDSEEGRGSEFSFILPKGNLEKNSFK